MSILKEVLFEEYGGFADKRIKRLESGSTFIADDRGGGDFGADKKLFLWFCSIFVEIKSESTVVVNLVGGVPRSSEIDAWVKSNKIEFQDSYQERLEVPLSKGEQGRLLELASLMESIVAPKKGYPVKAYKYVCPRTAKSLRRLAATLSRVWESNPEPTAAS